MTHIDSHGGRFSASCRAHAARTASSGEWAQTHASRVDRGLPPATASARATPTQVWRIGARADPDLRGSPDRLGALHARSTQRDAETRRAEDRARPARPGSRPGRLAGPALRGSQTRVAVRRGRSGRAGQHRRGALDRLRRHRDRPRRASARRSAADPATDTRYRKTDQDHASQLTVHIDDEQVAYDAATDGCFPLDHQRPRAHRPRAAGRLPLPAQPREAPPPAQERPESRPRRAEVPVRIEGLVRAASSSRCSASA